MGEKTTSKHPHHASPPTASFLGRPRKGWTSALLAVLLAASALAAPLVTAPGSAASEADGAASLSLPIDPTPTPTDPGEPTDPDPIDDPGGGGLSRWDIVRSARDACDRPAKLRYGWWDGANGGNNHRKIKGKHNIGNTNVWKFVVRNPNCGYATNGQARRYYAHANKIECDSSGQCRLVDERILKLIEDYRTNHGGNDGKAFGAVSMWCIGYDRCPNWVDSAFNVQGGGDYAPQLASPAEIQARGAASPDGVVSVLDYAGSSFDEANDTSVEPE